MALNGRDALHGPPVTPRRPGSVGGAWMPVCRYEELTPEQGVEAMVDGRQVALFRTYDGQLYAGGTPDPLEHIRVVDGYVEIEL